MNIIQKYVLPSVVLGLLSWNGYAKDKLPPGYYFSPMQWDDNRMGTATDVSFLNHKPAGINGRIIARDGHFYESKTGKRIRFIGIGIGGRSIFEITHKMAEKIALRFAKNGINVVRFHNHDGTNHRDSIIDFSKKGTGNFDADRLDKFEYLFAKLKEQGIYIVMPLKVNRKLNQEDGVPKGTGHKTVDRFDKVWIEKQKEWAKKTLTRINPYTKMTIAEDPAVIAVELNNENCILRPWLDTDKILAKLTPFHKAELTGLWNDWLLKKYRTEQSWHNTWGDVSKKNLSSWSLEKKNIPLPKGKTGICNRDKTEFLADVDRRYADTMRNYLQNELRVKCMIVDTQIDWGGLSSLHREANSDYIDTHGYWGLPEFRGTPWSFKRGNWKIPNKPQIREIANKNQCKLAELASWRLKGKPYSISEYDYPYPSDYIVEMMPLFAVIADRQDWDALHLFINGIWGSITDSTRITSMFDQSNHPGKIGFFPAAALIYRTGMFPPAAKEVELKLGRKPWLHFKNRYNECWAKSIGGTWRDLLTERVMISDQFLNTDKSVVKTIIRNAKNTSCQTQAWNEGKNTYFTAFSPRGAIISGHFGVKAIATNGFKIDAKPFPGNFGSVVIVSRTDQSLSESDSLLLTIAGRFENSGIKWNRRRNSTMVSGGAVPGLIDAQLGDGPVMATELDAVITLPISEKRQIYALDLTGKRKHKVPAKLINGSLTFSICPEHQAMYYEIIK